MEKTSDELSPDLVAYLSDGNKIYLNILPDAAYNIMEDSFIPICRMNCSIEIEEIGNAENSKIIYKIDAKKNFFLGLKFKTKVYVDALNGEIIDI